MARNFFDNGVDGFPAPWLLGFNSSSLSHQTSTQLLVGGPPVLGPGAAHLRFGLDEICPTAEEFHTYLRSYDSAVPVIPDFKRSFPPLLVDGLGAFSNTSGNLVLGSGLKIARLIELFGDSGNMNDPAW